MILPILQDLDYTRVQSPSSINTFKQCPRKYYYHYIEELPTSGSIHTIRGNIAHSALEDFFLLSGEVLTDNYEFEIRIILKDLLLKHWTLKLPELRALDLFDYELDQYYKETVTMMDNWCTGFIAKLQERDGTISEAFEEIKPITEQEYRSEQLGVRGFIDAIHNDNGDITLLDYKTSKRNTYSPEYKLQLGIYALLYQLEHGIIPKYVGINFLRHDEQIYDVDQELLDFAFKEIMEVHQATVSRLKEDYPLRTSGLCKWRTGQCDYYDTCRPFG